MQLSIKWGQSLPHRKKVLGTDYVPKDEIVWTYIFFEIDQQSQHQVNAL